MEHLSPNLKDIYAEKVYIYPLFPTGCFKISVFFEPPTSDLLNALFWSKKLPHYGEVDAI